MVPRSGANAVMAGVTPNLNLSSGSRISVLIKGMLAAITNKPPFHGA